MPALSKIAKEGVESAADFLKSFSDKTYYHTTPMGEIEGGKFDPNFSLEDGKGLGATYFTKDKNFANDIAEQFMLNDPNLDYSEITTYPVKIKTKDLFDYKNKEHIEKLASKINLSAEEFSGIKLGDPYLFEADKIQSSIKNLGFRGYHIDEPGSVGLFYPDKGDVRSIFAKFDPAKEKSGNILASVPAAALTGYGALEAINGQSID